MISGKDVEFWCEGDSSSENEAAYDEDDENAENNWRNDYPDDDPMYFERLHLDDNYSSDDGECYVATIDNRILKYLDTRHPTAYQSTIIKYCHRKLNWVATCNDVVSANQSQ